MKEADAAEVLLLRAVETAPHAGWSDDDAAWATRVAREQAGSGAPAEAFLAARARAAAQRLAPKEPALARWRRWALEPLRPRRAWAAALVALAFAVGAAADHIGAGQRVDLLAPPVWAVVAWNLAVYGAWAFGLLRRGPPRLPRAIAGALRRIPAREGAVFGRFAADWLARTAALNAARIAVALHAAAAALAAGIAAGMYLRGLVLDYRAGWQSTFLDGGAVHALLAAALAPASAVTGIAIPDAAGIAALRLTDAGSGGASAAPWIHLYAATLGLFVIGPRLALALAAAWRSGRLARRVDLPLDEPYFRRLLARQGGAAPRLQLFPYAIDVDAGAVQALRAALVRRFGADATLQAAPAVAFGAEDDLALPPDDGFQPVALFDLAATPEAENHGRFAERLSARGAAQVWVDEAAFRARFGDASPRLATRREAWSAFAAARGASAVFVDTRRPDAAAIESALLGGGRG